jgi:hypothetical protein
MPVDPHAHYVHLTCSEALEERFKGFAMILYHGLLPNVPSISKWHRQLPKIFGLFFFPERVENLRETD